MAEAPVPSGHGSRGLPGRTLGLFTLGGIRGEFESVEGGQGELGWERNLHLKTKRTTPLRKYPDSKGKEGL